MGRMTRRLILIRHAEADMTPHGGGDHERTLSAYGVRQATEIGRLIAVGTLPRPELVFTSSAVRARQTWEAAASRAALDVPTVADRALYSAHHDDLVAVLREVPDAVGAVALVGHAPEIPGLAFSVELSDADITCPPNPGIRIFNPCRSARVLISLRNQPPIWVLVLPAGN